MKTSLYLLILLLYSFSLLVSCQSRTDEVESVEKEKTLTERIESRDYPSVFQAWNPIDMPEYPLNTLEQRIKTAAKHDLIWEEPISQLGYGVDLVLGIIWDHEYQGLATKFTKESHEQALKNRKAMLELNPNMVFIMEIRWRDAPSSYLPEDSDWWMKNEDGTNVEGWLGGPEPYLMLNYENPEFVDHVAQQALVALESGVYDGIMLDWSGNLGVIKKIREVIKDKGLIIVNIHDDIHDGEEYQQYINGSFMELNVVDELYNDRDQNARSWDKVEEALIWFETNLQAPQINCLEVWGDRDDLRRMRATTTLGLTRSNGYVLFGDPNWLKTPDHYHDWYPFWDADLGKPVSPGFERSDGAVEREFENAIVIYNPERNEPINVTFESEMTRVSDGSTGKEFLINNIDGDIFIK